MLTSRGYCSQGVVVSHYYLTVDWGKGAQGLVAYYIHPSRLHELISLDSHVTKRARAQTEREP